jgi:hypothetical protein
MFGGHRPRWRGDVRTARADADHPGERWVARVIVIVIVIVGPGVVDVLVVGHGVAAGSDHSIDGGERRGLGGGGLPGLAVCVDRGDR